MSLIAGTEGCPRTLLSDTAAMSFIEIAVEVVETAPVCLISTITLYNPVILLSVLSVSRTLCFFRDDKLQVRDKLTIRFGNIVIRIMKLFRVKF